MARTEGYGVGLTIGLALVASAMLFAADRRSRLPTRTLPPPAAHPTAPIKDLRGILTADSRFLGPAFAPEILVEFSDFQCPFCAQFSVVLDSLRVEHHDSIRIVYRHFPLTSIHPMAFEAALAAECAGAQGEFESMYHALFAHQAEFGRVSWTSLATAAGVRDSAMFATCVRDSVYAPRVRRDRLEGVKLGITGTPSLVIGHSLVQGAVSVSVLDSLLARRQLVPPRTSRNR